MDRSRNLHADGTACRPYHLHVLLLFVAKHVFPCNPWFVFSWRNELELENGSWRIELELENGTVETID